MYLGIFAKCFAVITPLLLVVKEENFGHHLCLVECTG